MRSFDWEGLKEEIHQHFQEFVNYLEFGRQHDSMKGLFQPYLPSLERGERSMHHSICMRSIVGEESDHVKKVLFFDCTYSFTMFMQAMNLRRSNVSCKSHGKHWAARISEFGHSLDVQREIFYHDGCFTKEPKIYHTFSHSDITWAAIKWWGNHLPYLDLMHVGDALRWYHMWDYDPPPHAQISVYMYVVLLPYLMIYL